MLDSQKLAIAAHLHVLLRRKTGRVTDTEWMVGNVEYAREVIRFSRLKAREEGCGELQEWAGKLEAAVLAGLAPPAAARVVPPAASTPAPATPAAAPQSALDRLRERARLEASYVGGLR